MAYRRKNLVTIIALSKAETAAAVGCSIGVIDRAVAEKKLPIYRTPYGVRRDKILIESVIAWIKTWEQTNG
jgi:hypothetical protein